MDDWYVLCHLRSIVRYLWDRIDPGCSIDMNSKQNYLTAAEHTTSNNTLLFCHYCRRSCVPRRRIYQKYKRKYTGSDTHSLLPLSLESMIFMIFGANYKVCRRCHASLILAKERWFSSRPASPSTRNLRDAFWADRVLASLQGCMEV